MGKDVFRQKSLDRVNAPEDLNNCLKVTNPPLWFALAAIILILIGAIIWGCVAKIETKVDGVIVADETGSLCYVSEKNIDSISEGMTVRIGEEEYTITGISEEPDLAGTILTPYSMNLGGFEVGENVYTLTINAKDLKTGNYACDIVVESISPMSFLMNSN